MGLLSAVACTSYTHRLDWLLTTWTEKSRPHRLRAATGKTQQRLFTAMVYAVLYVILGSPFDTGLLSLF